MQKTFTKHRNKTFTYRKPLLNTETRRSCVENIHWTQKQDLHTKKTFTEHRKKTFICRVHSLSTETTPSQVDTEIIISHVEQKNKQAHTTEAMSNMDPSKNLE